MKPPKWHPLSERAGNLFFHIGIKILQFLRGSNQYHLLSYIIISKQNIQFQVYKSISILKLYQYIKYRIYNFITFSIYQIQNIQFHYFFNFIDGKFTNQYQFLSYIKISKKEYRYNYTTFSLSSMANADIFSLNDNTLYTYFDVLLIYEAWIQIYVLAGRSKFFDTP